MSSLILAIASYLCPQTLFLTPEGKERYPQEADKKIIAEDRCSAIHEKPMCTIKIILNHNNHRYVICRSPEYDSTNDVYPSEHMVPRR